MATRFAWDRMRTAGFLREQGIEPGREQPAGAGMLEVTARVFTHPETKRVTVVERRPRPGSEAPPSGKKRRLRWALTGAAAAVALSVALALGLRLSRSQQDVHDGVGERGALSAPPHLRQTAGARHPGVPAARVTHAEHGNRI